MAKDFAKVVLGKDRRGIKVYGVFRNEGNGRGFVQVLVGKTPGAMCSLTLTPEGLLPKGAGLVDSTVEMINAALCS